VAVERRSCEAVPGEAEEERRELTALPPLRLLLAMPREAEDETKPPALSEVASLITAVERLGRAAVLGETEVVAKSPELSEAACLIVAVRRPGCLAVLGEAGDVFFEAVARMVRTAPPQEQVHQSSCRGA